MGAQPNEGDLMLRRTEGYLQGASGKRLFRRAWLPEAPSRVVVLVHGFGEHCGRYEEMAIWLAGRGCAVHAYDQQGHGRSSGARGHADRFEDLLDDLAAFLDDVAEQHPDKPRVLIGHSMGGLVVCALAATREPEIDWLVSSAAALAISPDQSRLKLALARIFGRIWPTLAMDAGLDVQGLSRDPRVIERYQADPLVHGTMSAALASGMLEATVRTMSAAGQVRVPALILHGAADPLCLPAGSEAFYAGLPRDEVAGSELRTYPELKHEIFNEPERETVYGDVIAWVEAREASRPGKAMGSGAQSNEPHEKRGG
jgi:alpha-beta hydrolase superfamily lysophospholipase